MQTKIEKILNIVKDICNLADNEEVHLHHILRAIEKSSLDNHPSIQLTDDYTLYFKQSGTTMCYDKPLQDQSDEFISWLYGVLCE